jgi:hypothetical protein
VFVKHLHFLVRKFLEFCKIIKTSTPKTVIGFDDSYRPVKHGSMDLKEKK